MLEKYLPEIRVYYGIVNSQYLITPIPDIDIKINYDYNENNLIGYYYTITLNGFVTKIDDELRNIQYSSNVPDYSTITANRLILNLKLLRNILMANGNSLYIIKKNQTSTPFFKARGGTLRSLIFNDTNNWTNYIGYTAILDFEYITINSNDKCDNPLIDSDIVDISKYKLKSFQDNLSINFNENDAYSIGGTPIKVDNSSYNIEYNISAVGKKSYLYDNDTSEGPYKTVAAFEHAKNFVQNKLHDRLNSLIGGVLPRYLHSCAVNSNGHLLDKVSDDYAIFNEELTFEVSQSDGSCSANYKAIVKNTSSETNDPDFTTPNTRHFISRTEEKIKESNQTLTRIIVNGTIEGLCESKILSGIGVMLNNKGPIFNSSPFTSNAKYTNADSLWSKLYVDGLRGRNLKKDYRDKFGVVGGLLVDPCGTVINEPVDPDAPYPVSYSLTRNEKTGIINYTFEYSDAIRVQQGSGSNGSPQYTEVTIQTAESTPIVIFHNIPLSQTLPLAEFIGVSTSPRSTMTIKSRGSSAPQPNLGGYVVISNQVTEDIINETTTRTIECICTTSSC